MQNTIVILTLEKHKGGVWITRLFKCLKNLLTEQKGCGTTIQVQSLEIWMQQGFLVTSPCFSNISAIINRVSDAASPPLYKAALAVLGAAQSLGITIVNGPQTYALCGNKWCHHILFTQAGLKSPDTIAFWNEDKSKTSMECIHHKTEMMNLESCCTVLAKPNSGGFGAGIEQLEIPLKDHEIPVFDDSITLLQKYEFPRDNKLYRVWFLCGKVQCAVVRDTEEDKDQFTNACSGSCSFEKPPTAWIVPRDVKKELEEQLLPLLKDAHCGSVEFMYSQESTRLYFDLNLLSTLPINVKNDGAWENHYDPWVELARSIFHMIAQDM